MNNIKFFVGGFFCSVRMDTNYYLPLVQHCFILFTEINSLLEIELFTKEFK